MIVHLLQKLSYIHLSLTEKAWDRNHWIPGQEKLLNQSGMMASEA